MAYSRFLCFSLGFVLLFHVCFAQTEHRQGQQQPRRQCSLNNLNALEPTRKIQAEAGYSELWNNNEEQLQCAGVNVVRHVIQSKGLLLPFYTNAHKLFYIIEGRAIHGALMSGCPETYQSESESESRDNPRDQHQKIRQLREGDVVALHAGVAHWLYNNGNNRLVILTVEYVSQADNQLDENIRNFFLAGNPQESQRQSEGQTRQSQNSGNVFRGFDDEIISESFNIERNLARRLRGEDDKRGHIIQVQEELRLLTPESQEEEERQSERYLGGNGLEETLCTMRIKQNINDPKRADVYNPNGGRITTVNSLNLPILHLLQLSAERGVLYNNAILAPQWNLNSHSVVYITRGNGRIQIVGESGQSAFDGNVQQGQLIVVPQNFAVVKKAGRQGIEWIAVKTNDMAVTNQLAGRVSAIRSIPEQVLMNSYRISREEVRRLKQNRQEMTVFGPNSRPQRYSA